MSNEPPAPLRRARKRVERSSASSGAEMSKRTTSRKTTAKKVTATKITAQKAAPKRAPTPHGKGPTEKNLDIYGSAPIPWSRPLKQLEAGTASVVLAGDHEARRPTARGRRRRALDRRQDLLHEQS